MLNREMEDLRKQKDIKIIELNDIIERNRASYETTINSLKLTIEQITAQKLGGDSEILALQEALKKLCDIN